MARPVKPGLSYFPRDVDYYQDEKIMQLCEKYGPLGLTTYDVILTIVYREGYYIRLPISKAALYVVRIVGGNWYNKNGKTSIDLAAEIIQYCAEIGLINAPLVRQNVITSAGIQRRYASAKLRNKVTKTDYWLLDENGNEVAWESAPKIPVIAAETRVNVTETPVNAAIMQESKVNKSKVNKEDSPEVVIAAETREGDNQSSDGALIDNVLKEYARILPMLPDGRPSAKVITNLAQAGQDARYYTALFERAAHSTWLKSPQTGWRCTLEWLTDPVNAAKVIAGKYDDYQRTGAADMATTNMEPIMINGVQSGFDTDEFFNAAVKRSMEEIK